MDNEDGDNIYVAITNTLELFARRDANALMVSVPLHKLYLEEQNCENSSLELIKTVTKIAASNSTAIAYNSFENKIRPIISINFEVTVHKLEC